jgi:hypothetical protein
MYPQNNNNLKKERKEKKLKIRLFKKMNWTLGPIGFFLIHKGEKTSLYLWYVTPLSFSTASGLAKPFCL